MRLLFAILIFSHGPLLWAQNSTTVGESPTSRAPSPTPGSSINSDAKTGQNSQVIGQILNGMAGAYFTAECVSCPGFCMACPMALMAFASAAQMGKAAGQSGKTYDATTNWNTPAGGPNPGPDGGPPVLEPWAGLPDDKIPPGGPGAFNALSRTGWKFEDGKIKSPDGKIFKPEDFKSKEAMLNAGFSGAQASSAMASLAKINARLAAKAKELGADDPRLVGVSYDGSGGGGGGGRSPASDSSMDDYLKRLRNPFGLNGQQKGAMVAGKAISHGEDMVGVKFDNIFLMMNRAYQSRRDDEQFIEPKTPIAAAKPAISVPTARSSRQRK